LVMTNFRITEGLAELLSGKMLDGIIAPSFDSEAIVRLRRKGDKCRFIKNEALSSEIALDVEPRFRYVRGGFLRQPNYTFTLDLYCPELKRFGPAASERHLIDMLLAWTIGSTSNSNTVTLVKDGLLIGNGVGQQDRVGAAQLALNRAFRSGHDTHESVAYSDSFFPFPDGPQTLIDAGVKAILTSSGSIKDQATIDLCVQHGVTLYMIPDQIGRGFFGH